MEHQCNKCNTVLTSDEIALYRKLISRSAVTYLCLDCLAAELSTTREKLEELIEYFYRTGICTLFVR